MNTTDKIQLISTRPNLTTSAGPNKLDRPEAKDALQSKKPARQRALFLDRDGVINVDTIFLHKIEECQFLPGIFTLCRRAKQRGYRLIVVTNQSGIARGVFSAQDYLQLRDYIHQQFALHGCALDAEYCCPCHVEGIVAEYCTDSPYRKPKPGMFLQAAQDYQINLAHSILIGDKTTDILAAARAGVGLRIRVDGRSLSGARQLIWYRFRKF